MMEEMPRYHTKDGVWMVYDYNGPPYLIEVFEGPIKAIKKIANLGSGKIGFLPLGMEFPDAVEWWEEITEDG